MAESPRRNRNGDAHLAGKAGIEAGGHGAEGRGQKRTNGKTEGRARTLARQLVGEGIASGLLDALADEVAGVVERERVVHHL
jgi:hypothetical protein